MAKSLSFYHTKKEVSEKFLELFKDRHSSVLIIYSYEDNLHLSVKND